jgi:hypothetical protein
MLADMATSVAAARALYLAAARRKDAGLPFGQHAAMAKLFASDTAMKVTTDAVQVLGGYGYVEDFPVERLMREAKVLQIVEGRNQIQRMVIGRRRGVSWWRRPTARSWRRWPVAAESLSWPAHRAVGPRFSSGSGGWRKGCDPRLQRGGRP